MITDQDIQESRKVIQQLLREGKIVSADKERCTFFLLKSEQAVLTAESILRISGDIEFKKKLELLSSYEGYTWVINAAYYSMFYAATALLAHYHHHLNIEQGIHTLTYHAMVYYFLDNDQKLPQRILEQYKSTTEDATELLQLVEQKARVHVEQLKLESKKRKEFTYEMGKISIHTKANTSLQRAQEFLNFVKELVS